MKVCACIAEYNPMHKGHLKHIEYMKNVLGAEKIIVVMSGNFVQRGEPAVMNKYKRAKQAIIAGADIVLELPTVFSTANAEMFARGGINIINSLGVVDGLCFGVESGEKEGYINLAKALNDESKEFKKALKEFLDQGHSLPKSKFLALEQTSSEKIDQTLVSSPNNILGVEYTKALQRINSKIEIFPMERLGKHNDEELREGITSATSIRKMIKVEKPKSIKKYLPNFVYSEINGYPYAFDKMIYSKVITSSPSDLRQISDCTEGLENRIKALSKDNADIETLVEKVSTKRYPKTRVRRILISNFLGVKKDLVRECADGQTYAKVLAVDNDKKDILGLIKANSKIPILTRKTDTLELNSLQKKCYEIDVMATELYNLAVDEKENPHQMLLV